MDWVYCKVRVGGGVGGLGVLQGESGGGGVL